MMRSNSSTPIQPLASHMVLFAVRLTKSESDIWIGGLKSCPLKSGIVTTVKEWLRDCRDKIVDCDREKEMKNSSRCI